MKKQPKLNLFTLVIILSVITFSTYAANMDETDLVLYYSFDEESLVEGEVIDKSGNGYNGLIQGNNFNFAEGKVKQCLVFPGGAGNYIAVRNLQYNEAIPALSIAVWIKTSQRGVIASWDRSEFFRFAAADDQLGNTNFIAFDICCPVRDWHGTVDVLDNQWHHIVVTFSGEAKRIYLNGELDVEQKPHTQAIGPQAARFGFIGIGSEATEFNGPKNPTWSFKGLMDEYIMFHRVLTADEVTRLATTAVNPFAVDPTGKVSTTWGSIKSAIKYAN